MSKHLIPLLCFLYFGEVYSQFEWASKKDRITIPFELTHNIMIVDVVFNGTALKMILDTGSSKNLIFSVPANDSLVINEADKIIVSGAGTKEAIEGYLSKKNKLEIKDYTETDFEVIFLKNHEISFVNKLGIPVNGILGNFLFENHLVEIDYQRSRIIIYKEKEKKLQKLQKKYKKATVAFSENKPYIFLQAKVDDKQLKLKLLFDSGLSDGLWLFENDSIQCNKNYFVDVLGRGFSGDIEGKKSRVSEVMLEDHILRNALVAYPEKIFFDQKRIFKDRNGSLGGEIIKRFNWILDYKNKNFYFKKNDNFSLPFEYNMAGIEIQHAGLQWVKEVKSASYSSSNLHSEKVIFDNSNVKFNYQYKLKSVFEIYAIRKNSVAANAGLQVGDKIIKINNKEAHKLTVESITNLFTSESGTRIKISVEREGKELNFEFNLEKIL
ncbi:aspartyl protease family protein [Flavobacterium ardleyense]|uniref:Aspartyl protease family protein n=1 Tax=Flavobacterium ardleyense TaxID=2038737 RepID=A0ABW5Z6S0_9FLAO